MKVEITGFTTMKGVSKKSFAPYQIDKLFYLKHLKAWKNETGESKCAGFSADDNATLKIKDDDKLREMLLGFPYPSTVELKLEADPEDPLKNIVVDVNPIMADHRPEPKKAS